MSLTRINANVQALNNLTEYQQVNDKMAKHQSRIASGKRIKQAEEDPAGYHLARTLERRKRGLDQALNNVSNAKNILNVAEGGYKNVMNLLQTAKEKATQAADHSLSSTQRTAIDDQVKAMISEIDEIVNETTFNKSNLIDGNYEGKFQTGERANDQLQVSLGNADSGALNIDSVDLSTKNGASTAISTFSEAIDNLSSKIQDVGEYKARLNSKEVTLDTASNNTEAVRSSVEDADFAKEQMKIQQTQIKQQTAISALTQANSAPQSVLSLFGG